jgi:hypothetical protein
MNRNALRNRVDRFRSPEHFETDPTNPHEPEGLFQSQFTPRHAADPSAGQKKVSAAPVFPRPVSLGFEPLGAAKRPPKTAQNSRNDPQGGAKWVQSDRSRTEEAGVVIN